MLTLSPVAYQTFLDENGAPLSGGLIYTYASGTSTPQATYTDAAGLVPNANPIVCDSAGRCVIYVLPTSYKYVVKKSDGTLVRTVDPVTSVAVSTLVIGQSINGMGGDPDSPITSAAYASGATFDKCLPGSSWLSIDSANLNGTFALEGMGASSAGTLTVGLFNLTDAPNTAIVEVSFATTTGDRQTSSAITFATAGANKVYGLKAKNSSGYGQAWGFYLKRTA